MAGLLDKIYQDLQSAVKAKDLDGLRTLRFLLSAIHNLEIEKYPPEKGGLPATGLPDEDVLNVIAKIVKTHKESIEAFKIGNRQDLVSQEEKELAILQQYLPEPMSEEEIKKLVLEAKGKGLADFGRIMKEVMTEINGRADGGTVSKIVKETING